jgi:hypothetical protein
VSNYLKEQGKNMSDSPREVYFADWGKIKDSDPMCDVAFPFK